MPPCLWKPPYELRISSSQLTKFVSHIFQRVELGWSIRWLRHLQIHRRKIRGRKMYSASMPPPTVNPYGSSWVPSQEVLGLWFFDGFTWLNTVSDNVLDPYGSVFLQQKRGPLWMGMNGAPWWYESIAMHQTLRGLRVWEDRRGLGFLGR